MKNILFLIASLTSGALAQAANPTIQPKVNEPVCLMRQYSASHMAQNPKQKLSAIYIRLADATYTTENPTEIVHYTSSNVIGVSAGKFYGNDLAECTFNADGSAKCQVDCDGGSFGLYPRESDVLMRVSKDYYYPLYKGGYNQENPSPQDELSFDGNDENNNSYLLQQVKIQDCDRAIREMQKANFGC